MRRLTLILSDLYLPAHASRESFPATLALPALQWLLRFADRRRIDDWRSWLGRELGASAISEWPVAHVCALAAGIPVEGVWLASPVALEARLDHVRLRDRGLLRLTPEQQMDLQQEFARVFGDELSLQPEGFPSFLLRGGPRGDIDTRDPARLLDSDIGNALPAGHAEAGELRRLGAELEMWLHTSAVNAAREQAGQKRIASLWLWGGGRPRAPLPEPIFGDRRFDLHGNDSFVVAVRDLVGHEARRPAPAGFDALDAAVPTFVELAPMSGSSAESLDELERRWFEPSLRALTTGVLVSLRIVANDQMFDIRPRAGWKFWRPRRNWLQSLA